MAASMGDLSREGSKVARNGSSSSRALWHSRPRDEYVTSLRRGSSLLKYGRTGSPHFTFFRISTDESELVWKSDGLPHQGRRLRAVKLGAVTSIVEGQTTPTFNRDPKSSLAHLSFSLIYDKRGKERTLDLICKTEQEYELWLHGLQAFVGLEKERQKLKTGNEAQEGNRKSVSRFLGGSFHANAADLDDGEEATEDPSQSESGDQFLGDMYVWGGREADLSTPVEGWQQSLVPVLVNDSARLDTQQVAVATGHAILVTKHGQVYTWGRGSGGQLGHGSSQDCSQPKLVQELWQRNIAVQSVECSDSISLALTPSGDLYSWGDGKKSGVLGLGKMTDRHWTPRRLDFPFQSVKIKCVSAGPFHCAAISTLGGLYTWGDGFEGRLGHGNHESRFTPCLVEYFNDMRVTSVSCGVFHTAAVAVPRTCVQADERTPPGSPVPISAHDLLNQPAAAAAAFTAASLPEVPRDLNWGPFGAGGRAEGREKRHTPLLLCVPVSRGHNPMTAYSCGTNASDSTDTPITPATGKKGVVYTWGSNDRGCLGRGEEGQDDVGLLPGPVGGELEGLDVQKVACGYHLTAALTKCGRVFQWGSTGTAFSDSAPWTRCNEPKQVRGELDSWKVDRLACGNHHCIVAATGHHAVDPSKPPKVLFAWGRGVEGQLGNDICQDSSSPVKIKALKGLDVIDVIAGGNHTMAICCNNPAITEAAAMKDAERLKPFLLSVKAKDNKHLNLTIEVPNGYTAGGGPLTNASRASSEGIRLNKAMDAGALVLHQSAYSPLQTHTNQRHTWTGSHGTIRNLVRAAQAAKMAHKVAASASKGKPLKYTPINAAALARMYRPGMGSPRGFNSGEVTPRSDSAGTNGEGLASSTDASQANSSAEPSEDISQYIASLELQVAKLSNKVHALEEQLGRHVRREHEAVRSSFNRQSFKVGQAERLSKLMVSTSEAAVSDCGSTPARTRTSPCLRSNIALGLVPSTPHTVGNTGGALSPVTDGSNSKFGEGQVEGDSADNPNTSGSAVSASGSTANSPSGLSQATEATQGCGGRSLETARSRDPSVDRSEVSVFEHRSSLDDPGKQLPSVQRNRSVSADGIGIKDEAILLLKDENAMLREQLQQLQARLDAQERTRVFPSLAAGTMSRRSTLSGFSTASIALKSEWAETVHPGVHLTLGMGANGQPELRKVRFSSRAFSKSAAEVWWRENRSMITERYLTPDPQLMWSLACSSSLINATREAATAPGVGGEAFPYIGEEPADGRSEAHLFVNNAAKPITPVPLIPGLGGETTGHELKYISPADTDPMQAPSAAFESSSQPQGPDS